MIPSAEAPATVLPRCATTKKAALNLRGSRLATVGPQCVWPLPDCLALACRTGGVTPRL